MHDLGVQLSSLQETVNTSITSQSEANEELREQMKRYSRRLSEIAQTLKAMMHLMQNGQGQSVAPQVVRDVKEELHRHSVVVHDIDRRMYVTIPATICLDAQLDPIIGVLYTLKQKSLAIMI